jgi:hypothetical protein
MKKTLFLLIALFFVTTANAQFIQEVTATIDSAGSLSAAVDLDGKAIAYIDMPAAWTAAAITFQTGSIDTSGATFKDVMLDDGTEVSITVAVSDHVVLTPTKAWAFKRYVKIRSGVSATAVAQADVRTIVIGLKPL